MKRISLLFALLTTLPCLTNAGDGVADARLRLEINRTVSAMSRTGGDSDMEVPDRPAYLPLLVELSGPEGLTTLEDAGSVIMGRRGDIVLVCAPYDRLDILDPGQGLLTASMASRVCTTLDVARDKASVNAIHEGAGFAAPYDGSGVVTGFCDIGFDPGHSAFAGGRLKKLVVYDTFNGVRRVIENPYEEGTPESPDNYHATHVAGILAGGRVEGSPYYGAAPGADIVATVSDLTDVAILAGIDDIISYARETGKPAVVNISLSSYLGPHDGTTLFNRYLDMQAEEAIICISAGNNGNSQTTLHQTVKTGDDILKTCLTTWDNMEINADIDIWASDSSPLSLYLSLWDTVEKRVTATLTRPITGRATISSDDGAKLLPGFAEYFDGSIEVDAEINRLNSRGHMIVKADYRSKVPGDDRTSRYLLVVGAGSRPGTRIDMFGEGKSLMFRGQGVEGARYGDATMSFNDLAASDGAIMVGMLNDRDIIPVVNSPGWCGGFETNVISPNSSYGIRPDGTLKPDISAPGNLLVSALSAPYYEGHPDVRVSAVTRTDDGREDRWFALGGTSMSSPLVAGVIATWAQAVPTLTVGQARRALTVSADTPADADNPRYGASGALNAARGLTWLKNNVGLTPAVQGSQGIKLVGSTIIADNAAGIEIFDFAGRLVASCSGGAADVSSLAAGVYIVRTSAGNTARILLR